MTESVTGGDDAIGEGAEIAEEGARRDGGSGATGAKELATGGAALGIAMMLANAGNYVLNIFLGRWLTQAEFADANLMVTLMLLATAIAISLQLIAARFTGVSEVAGRAGDGDRVAAWLERRAAIAGVAIGLLLAAGAPFWATTFRSESAIPFVILGVGMPAYLVQAVGRGVLQGRLAFRPLAATFIVEMIVRVTLGLVLVAMGFGVIGATVALTASFVATWLHVRLLRSGRPTGEVGDGLVTEVVDYAKPVAVLLLGQIIINNGDVLIAKRFLEPDTAGLYAAIALVGRAVFFLSWSVATTLFPASARRDEAGEDTDGLLHAGLAIVAVMGVGFVGGALLLGDLVLGRVLGPEYGDVAGPLARYAFATSMFAMANLIVSHHLAAGHTAIARLLVLGGVLQTTLLMLQRDTVDRLIDAQVQAMALLLVITLVGHVVIRRNRTRPLTNDAAGPMVQQATTASSRPGSRRRRKEKVTS